MKPFFFDIHSHIHSDFFKGNKKPILEEMKKKNIFTISVGVSYNDSKEAILLSSKYNNLFATIGIHPLEKENFEEDNFQKLLDQNKNKIVGIGECGLDYYWPNNDLKGGKICEADFALELKRQNKLFIDQINFALKNNLPMMLHIRSYKNSDAYFDAFEILKKYQNTNLKVNFHFFTENKIIVKKILDLNNNYTCSIPGVVTFANLDESIKLLPLEKIMSETDSPFASPIPFRGKQNTPLHIEEIVKKISEIKKIDIEKTKTQLVNNALNFWNIKYK